MRTPPPPPRRPRPARARGGAAPPPVSSDRAAHGEAVSCSGGGYQGCPPPKPGGSPWQRQVVTPSLASPASSNGQCRREGTPPCADPGSRSAWCDVSGTKLLSGKGPPQSFHLNCSSYGQRFFGPDSRWERGPRDGLVLTDTQLVGLSELAKEKAEDNRPSSPGENRPSPFPSVPSVPVRPQQLYPKGLLAETEREQIRPPALPPLWTDGRRRWDRWPPTWRAARRRPALSLQTCTSSLWSERAFTSAGWVTPHSPWWSRGSPGGCRERTSLSTRQVPN